ncbi:ion transporter [soil metagenome]
MPNSKSIKHKLFKERIHEIIFEADTAAGKAFDIILLVAIVLSVLVVVLESINNLQLRYQSYFTAAEWFFTALFTLEYMFRLYSVKRSLAYAKSFFGVIDLLAILPTYLSIFFPGSQYLLTIRALRLLRVFRIFKITRYLEESNVLVKALVASRIKISIFMFTVMMIVLIMGSVMYFVESEINPAFANIPQSMYWAIVTVTTVGYGDIAPASILGRLLAAALMILGYAIIAVPTGIVSAEMVKAGKPDLVSTQHCPHCQREGHDLDATHCKYCGELL